jgi:peptidoglycan hydrolase FlgJ
MDAIPKLAPTAMPAAAKPEKGPERVREAARQFEALLVGQLVRSMREESGGWLSTGADDAAGGIATEFAEQQFAEALAAQGGLGLAAMVVRGLAGSADADLPPALPPQNSRP